MLNSLSGTVTSKKAGRIMLLTGEIEWEIWTTDQSMSLFPDTGESTRVLLYLHHREDQLRLFGFATEVERRCFLDLLTVQSIGPRLAMKILSGISTEQFIEAVDQEDLTRLSAVPGLGRTTAQKVILKLKGKLLPQQTEESSRIEDIVNDLAGMGFDRRAAVQVAGEIARELKNTDIDEAELEREILKRSIQRMSRNP